MMTSVQSVCVRRLAETLALVLVAGTSTAQSTAAWSVQAPAGTSVVNTPLDLVSVASGGTALLVRTQTTPGGDLDTQVVRLSENGDVLWTWTAPEAPFGLDADDLGRLYVLCRETPRSVLTSLDQAGFERWSIDLDGPSTTQSYVANTLDVGASGDVRVAGWATSSLGYPRTILHAVDANGVQQWRVNLGAGGPPSIAFGFPKRVVLDSLGVSHVIGQLDFCCGGRAWSVQLVSPSGLILRQDSGQAGNEANFDAVYGAEGPAGTVAVGYDGILVPALAPAVPGLGLQIYDNGASPLDVDLLPLSNQGGEIQDVESDGAGNFLVGFSTPHTVVRVSAAGSILASEIVPGEVHALAPTPDGGAFALCEAGAPDEYRLVRLAADLSILSVQTSTGRIPSDWIDGAPDLAPDGRGNVAATLELPQPATPSQSLASVTRWIDGGPVGSAYCGPAPLNSSGSSGEIQAVGSLGVQENNLTLIGSSLPANTTVLFLASRTSAFVVGPGGSAGNLCLGGTIGRFALPGQVRTASSSGSATLQIDLEAIPQASALSSGVAGETWRFQGWFRDTVAGAPGSNLTDGVAATLL